MSGNDLQRMRVLKKSSEHGKALTIRGCTEQADEKLGGQCTLPIQQAVDKLVGQRRKKNSFDWRSNINNNRAMKMKFIEHVILVIHRAKHIVIII